MSGFYISYGKEIIEMTINGHEVSVMIKVDAAHAEFIPSGDDAEDDKRIAEITVGLTHCIILRVQASMGSVAETVYCGQVLVPELGEDAVWEFVQRHGLDRKVETQLLKTLAGVWELVGVTSDAQRTGVRRYGG